MAVNILLVENLHVTLADYGSATKMINGKVTSNIPVGTPDYISPDILSSTGKGATYGPEVDIWSYGITLYEMLYGDPPFLSQKGLHETYTKIENIDINYPETRENEEGGRESMPDDFLDLLKNLICKAERRLSIENIKKHAFFKSIDWCNLKKYNLKRNKIIRDIEMVDFNSFKDFKGDHSIFLGFTFDPEGVKNISKFFAEKKENEDADQYAPIEYGGCHLSEEVSSLKEKLEEKERELREKVDSLVRNNIRLSEKESELERVRSELTEMQNKLERMEVLREMEEIDKRRNLEMENRRAEIEKIKIDEIKNNKLA
ncbi:Serine/threonine-protein kinase MRCK beta, partial [Dictyocoela roeselum]